MEDLGTLRVIANIIIGLSSLVIAVALASIATLWWVASSEKAYQSSIDRKFHLYLSVKRFFQNFDYYKSVYSNLYDKTQYP